MQLSSRRYDLILSYTSQDADFALKLASDLKETGFNIWVDRFDLVTPQDSLYSAEQVAADATGIILVLSSHYANSKARQSDFQRAGQTKKHILPVLLRPWELPDWARPMDDYQHLDFTQWRSERHYQARLESLIALLKQHFPVNESNSPSNEQHYIHRLTAEIESHKSLLRDISPPSESLPSDKRAIYTRSLWGLNGQFEVLDGPLATTGSVYKIQDLVDNLPQFVMLGAPGAGKTTALYRIALDTLYNHQASQGATPLPLLLDLATWSHHHIFQDFIRAHWPAESDALELITSGNLLVLLDGLEDIPGSQPEKVATLRQWLASLPATARVIVACAADRYSTHLMLNLPRAALKPLSRQQVRDYVNHHLNDEMSAGLLALLIQDSNQPGASQLHRLAQNTLFLAILVSIKQYAPGAILPEHAGLLLQWLARMLWDRYHSSSTRFKGTYIRVPSYELAERALSKMAFAMIDDDQRQIPYRWALDHTGDEAILSTALSANILKMRGDYISFSHSLLHDYFAAVALEEEGVYTRLMRAQFDDHGQRQPWKWDRPVVLLSGITPEPDIVVQHVAEVNPYVAVDCITSGVSLLPATRQQIADLFLNQNRPQNGAPVPDIVQVMRSIADEITVTTVLEHLHNELESAIKQTWDVNEDIAMPLRKLGTDTISFLMDILRGEKWQRRRGAAWALGELQEPAAVPSLVEALGDENPNVRKEAAFALVKIGRPAMPRLLKALRQGDSDLRAVVITTLAQMRDPGGVPDLITCLEDANWPQHEDVRICDLAARALEYIGTQEARQAVANWRQNGDLMSLSHEADRETNGGTKFTVVQRLSERPVPNLVTDLQDAEWSVRRDAVKYLGDTGDPAVLPHLLKALKDGDNQVRWTAVQAVSNFTPDAEIIQGLLAALRDEDCLVCDAASEALARIGPLAVPGLITALQDENPDVRGAAIEALGRIGSEDVVAPLVACLEDTTTPRLENQRLCDMAAAALEAIGSEAALDALLKWRQDEQSSYVLNPMQIDIPLLELDSLSASSPVYSAHHRALLDFLDTLHEQDWHTQQKAARSLREFAKTLKGTGDAQVLEELSSALNDDTTLVRWTAVEALAWMGHSSAIPALVEALHDESWTVRIAAVRALVEITDVREAFPDLISTLNDDHPLVREAAAETLGKIGDHNASAYLVQALLDKDSFVRRSAAEALGNLGDLTAVPNLINALKDDQHYVRRAVARALGKIGDPAAIPALIDHLDDTRGPEWEESRMCDIVAEALAAVGTPQAMSALEKWRSRRVS